MIRKLAVIFFSGTICLLGVTSAFAVKYNEAPMLRTMVAAGELPPVEERLPVEPRVIEPFEKIGQYGGTARVFNVDTHAWNDWQQGTSNWGGLFETSRDGISLQPNIAKGYEWSEDLKTLTIYLRKGLKWSDGELFTADDIVFQFEDVYGNDELTPSKPENWSPGGKLLKAIKVDDYTVRLETSIPFPMLEANLRTWMSLQQYGPFNCKHYLKKWHIKYNPRADELAKEEGFEHWWQAFSSHAQIYSHPLDPALPRMTPWIVKKTTTDSVLFERNPYYYHVDTAGNQLPYIDRVLTTTVSKEVYQMKAVSGEADFAYTVLDLINYPLYKENEKKGDYRVVLDSNIWGEGNALALAFNFNEGDPVLRKIYHDIRFRQALSLAINRDEINEQVFFGQAVPAQVAPLPGSSYYKKEWAQSYIQYDPETANHLLDEMGLKRGKDGFRLRPDGKRLELTIIDEELVPAVLELVKEYWEAVGVKTALKQVSQALQWEMIGSSDHPIMSHPPSACEIAVFQDTARYFGHGGELSWFADWWHYGKQAFNPEGVGFDPKGAELVSPEDQVTFEQVKEQYNRIQKWNTTRMGSKEYLELAEQIFDYFSKQLWCIGTVERAPWPYIVKNNLRNVPVPWKDINSHNSMVNAQSYADQFFFEQ